MNLIAEQQILIREIFAATVNPNDSAFFYLREFSKEFETFGSNASLVEHNTYFDSILMERLQAPNTQILAYLQQSWSRAQQALDKPWNNHLKQFINYSIEIIKNFIILSLQQDQIFPEQMNIQPNTVHAANKTVAIAMKVITHFQRKGHNAQLMEIIINRMDQSFPQFPQEILNVLLARQRFQTVLQPRCFFYLNFLNDILSQPRFRQIFFSLKGWKSIHKEMDKLQGNMVDTQSALGIFMRSSVLGQRVGHYHQEKQAVLRMEQRMIAQLGTDKLSRNKLKFYSNLQSQFAGKFTQLYKTLLKKQTKNQLFDWTYGLLISNISKTKLSSRLASANTSSSSHDGLLMNIYSIFLNLCKAIVSRQDNKYKSIDPNYFRQNQYMHLLKYDHIHGTPLMNQAGRKQFGTITEFFFLCLQFMHVGVCGAIDNFNQLGEFKKKIEGEIARLPANHYLKQQGQQQINKVQASIIRYYTIIFDQNTVIPTTKVLDLLMELLPEWLGIDYNSMKGARLLSKGGELKHFLPQFLLTIIVKYHSAVFNYIRGYLSMIGEQQLRKIVELTCFLIADQDIVTNPYISAQYIQLLWLFLHDNKAGVMNQVFRSSPVALNNITFGMIRFYCNIALTGRSNQFYEKFKYRFYANKIFTTLWSSQVYRKDLKNYIHTPLFQKFLNMVMTDTSYCFQQINQNYQKYKQLQAKKAQGPLSADDLKNQDLVQRIIGSTLNQSTSNLKLMRDLSQWSPETFLTQADRKTVVPLMNNIIKTFVDPGAFSSDPQLVSKFKFQRAPALADLIQIYANLDINQILSTEIVKDGRYYKKEYFSKALQKASNEHHTQIDILQKFQALIVKLSTAADLGQQDQQIYGEIPDKYLCALMQTLMKDPVLLPGSGNVVDRVNIHRALLIDQRDPFTRQMMKESQLVEQRALREQIEVWKKRRLQELKKGGKEVKYGKMVVVRQEEGMVFGDKGIVKEDQ